MSNDIILGRSVLGPASLYDFVRTEISEAQHPLSLALLEYWRELERDGGMRLGRDIPARALAAVLPYTIIAQPVGQWDNARVRLAGTALVERFGRDITGMMQSEIFGPDPNSHLIILKLSRRAVKTRDPSLIETRISKAGIEAMRLEIVLVPINSPDGSEVWGLGGVFKF